MNANLLSRLFLAWGNLCLRRNELERLVEEQAAEISQLKPQLQNEIAKCQQVEAALAQVQDQLEIKADSVSRSETRVGNPNDTELINDCQQVEEALKISEERFRVALKNSPIIVFNQDTDLRYTWIYNPAPELDAVEMVGKLDSELLPPEDAQRLTTIKRRVLTTGVGERQETFVTLNGEVRYYDLTVEPLLNQAGEVVGITSAATDVTNLRLRKQLEALFDEALDAILITDEEGTYVEANPAACQLFGLVRSELLGKRIADFMVPGFDFALAWQNFLELGQGTGEFSLLRPDGTVREVEYTAKANFLPGQHLSILRDITKRKQAQEALQKSQRFIEQITDTSPTLLYIYDLRQDCNVWANPRSEEFCGCTQKQMQAMGSQLAAECLHPEDWQQLEEFKERLNAAKDGEVIESEYRMKNAQGEWRWLHVWEIIFTRTADGKPEQILGTAIDVTEPKLAKEKLYRREEAFRTLAENSPDLIARFDRQLRHIYVNPAIECSTGMPASAFIGKTNQELKRPVELVSYWNQATQQVFETGCGELIEFDFPTPTGVRSYQSHLVPEYAQDGSVEFVLGVARDITERKQAERALTKERNFISAIFDTASVLIVVLDSQGRIFSFNRACEEMTGYSFEEVRGKYIWDLFLIPEEVESVKAVFNELQVGSSPNQHENYWVARDGSRRLIRWSNTIFRDANREVVANSTASHLSNRNPNKSSQPGVSGTLQYIIGSGIDISDRQQAEEARQALAREQELNQLRTNFFTMASHELRTPLTVILLTVQSLEAFYDQWPEDKKIKKLSQIEVAAQRMKHLIDKILFLHRKDGG